MHFIKLEKISTNLCFFSKKIYKTKLFETLQRISTNLKKFINFGEFLQIWEVFYKFESFLQFLIRYESFLSFKKLLEKIDTWKNIYKLNAFIRVQFSGFFKNIFIRQKFIKKQIKFAPITELQPQKSFQHHHRNFKKFKFPFWSKNLYYKPWTFVV